MKHRINFPVLLQPLQCQPFEEFLFPLVIGFEGGKEQTLPEAARTAEQVVFPALRQFVHKGCLVHINIAVFSKPLEILQADRIFGHSTLILEFDGKITKN